MKNNITPLKVNTKPHRISLDNIHETLSKLAQSGEFCPFTTEVLYQTISIVEKFEELIIDEVEA